MKMLNSVGLSMLPCGTPALFVASCRFLSLDVDNKGTTNDKLPDQDARLLVKTHLVQLEQDAFMHYFIEGFLDVKEVYTCFLATCYWCWR